jgi:hypothetical protein
MEIHKGDGHRDPADRRATTYQDPVVVLGLGVLNLTLRRDWPPSRGRTALHIATRVVGIMPFATWDGGYRYICTWQRRVDILIPPPPPRPGTMKDTMRVHSINAAIAEMKGTSNMSEQTGGATRNVRTTNMQIPRKSCVWMALISNLKHTHGGIVKKYINV